LLVHGQAFRWGHFASQLITFAITASVVYFAVVVPMHLLIDRRRRGVDPGPAQPTQIELLMEIRDLLRAQHNGAVPAPQPQLQQRHLPPVPPRRDA
jgi:large conductance mechanosensitive channel